MNQLYPEKLSVDYREGVTSTGPIIPRRYTLTHSDITAELFLTIGLSYAYDKVNATRNEFLGQWIQESNSYLYYVYLYVDSQFGPGIATIRNYIFRRELPLALEAIRYGDREFFSEHSELDQSPIIVFFMSTNPAYNKVENWGSFSDYDINNSYILPQVITLPKDRYLLDMKVGDVTGDGIEDKVSLYGSKQESTDIFADNITIEIEDGSSYETITIIPEANAGYDARLFFGDFTKDNINDIKLSIDSGGSGGYGYFYIYSYINDNFQEIFDFDKYNNEYQYKVDYNDLYKVSVGNVMLDKLFVLDISYKGYDYLSQYYYEDHTLKEPVQGEVLALSALVPIVNNEGINGFDLLAFQRIIGTTNSDTIGYIENLLSWDGQKFVSSRMLASISGTNLITLY